MSDKARYFMIGGFLGAGKTTAVAALAAHLTRSGMRVGLITNDQGSELVDTSMLRSRGFATEEIPGGCFCCRFNSLVEAARKLTESARPDAFVAEPVGSCTDLMATVSYPLRRIYGDRFAVAPLSVLVDPVRARQILGMAPGRGFSEKVRYIWRKQIEEAGLVVITKADLLSPSEKAELQLKLENEFPGKPVIAVSVRTGDGVEAWFSQLTRGDLSSGTPLEIDYDIYADGEALLGWLNATIEFQSHVPRDASTLLRSLAAAMQHQLRGAEIAHLKMTFSPEVSLAGEIAALSVVRSDIMPELTMQLEAASTRGEIVVNCRAEAAPETLRAALDDALETVRREFPASSFSLDHIEQFRPGRPSPTHRLLTSESTLAV